MKEKKLFEELLEQQENFYDNQQTEKILEEFLQSEENLLNSILVYLSKEYGERGGEYGQILQDAFEEYKQARREVFNETKEIPLRDFENSLPDNLWIRIMYKNEPAEQFGLPSISGIVKKLTKGRNRNRQLH
jgi:hypothetical protein